MSLEYLPIEQVRTMNGLRIVCCANVPSPWSLAARAVFDHKKVPYVIGEQLITQENAELKAWTGQNSAPVVAWRETDDYEKLATTAENIVLLAEKLQPEPALIPKDPQQQAWMFGLLLALTGENGFAWCRRLMSLSAVGSANLSGGIKQMALKYDYSDQAAEQAGKRAAEVLRLFAATLHEQQSHGSEYLVGDSVSALDFYFALFLGIMYRPLPAEVLPMPDAMRGGYELPAPVLDEAADPILFTHRDRILERYIETPLRF